MITLHNLTAGYGKSAIVTDISLSFCPGQVLVLVGANGCGKSTLLKTALGLLPKTSGEILYDGVPIEQLSTREIAQKVSFLSQRATKSAPQITAQKMVLHGRFAYLSYPRRYRPADFDIAHDALRRTNALPFAQRLLPELSGGQQQNVFLSMTLAQTTQTVLMDEPTTYLDIAHQLRTIQIAKELAQSGKAVVLILHDLSLALRHADSIAVLEQGKLCLQGTPEQVYQSKVLNNAFDICLKRVATDDGWHYYYG